MWSFLALLKLIHGVLGHDRRYFSKDSAFCRDVVTRSHNWIARCQRYFIRWGICCCYHLSDISRITSTWRISWATLTWSFLFLKDDFLWILQSSQCILAFRKAFQRRMRQTIESLHLLRDELAHDLVHHDLSLLPHQSRIRVLFTTLVNVLHVLIS